MSDKNWKLELNEYIRQGEPDKVDRSNAWKTAIGLQDVDGLKPSEYLIETAKEHIEGKILQWKDKLLRYYKGDEEDLRNDGQVFTTGASFVVSPSEKKMLIKLFEKEELTYEIVM